MATPSTTVIQELVNQVDSFLYKKIPEDEKDRNNVKLKMLEDTMTPEEARVMRSTGCVEVTVHGTTTNTLTIEGLESKFEKENSGNSRVTIPSTDMLQHHWKAGHPLHVTQEEALREMEAEFTKMFSPKKERLHAMESDIEIQIEEMQKHGQIIETTAKNIADLVEVIIVQNPPNAVVRRKMEREIKEALLKPDLSTIKTQISDDLQRNLQEGISSNMLTKDK